ncbi:MAG: hypothetical protein RMX65_034870 [Nostoc sp. DedQUE01]|uniref:hypothetical protein n=1 Tax=Nostoc sp. CCY 9925 TaxID=3103865 RepID=UPI002ADB3070|nr:hypothetical protein [Nostoc sp. DedQUE11]MDZ8073016.1 hypothetical protein [Nostoc sp. DedQUE01]MDZ8081698.1 hypothetical protein [Nostoc sp. DcaGUA01]
MKFNIDEYVQNSRTGQVGRVIGYGHEMINNVYTITLKVLIAEAANSSKRLLVLEDGVSAWSLMS